MIWLVICIAIEALLVLGAVGLAPELAPVIDDGRRWLRRRAASLMIRYVLIVPAREVVSHAARRQPGGVENLPVTGSAPGGGGNPGAGLSARTDAAAPGDALPTAAELLAEADAWMGTDLDAIHAALCARAGISSEDREAAMTMPVILGDGSAVTPAALLAAPPRPAVVRPSMWASDKTGPIPAVTAESVRRAPTGPVPVMPTVPPVPITGAAGGCTGTTGEQPALTGLLA